MAWAETILPQYDRRACRYASDCSDEEWSLEHFLIILDRNGIPTCVFF